MDQIKEIQKRIEKIELQVGIQNKPWAIPTRKKVKGKNGKVN